MQKKIFISVLLLIVLLLSACSSSSNEPANTNNGNGGQADTETTDPVAEEPEEITLVFFNQSTHIEEYLEMLNEQLGKRFPHITFEWHSTQVHEGARLPFEEKIAEGVIPDLMFIQDSGFSFLQDFGMLYDLSELIEQSNFDMSRFPEDQLEAMRIFQPDRDGIYALPRRSMYHALAYNKDIFDLFGVGYPEDDMTWDEILDLAVRTTGERGGVQYRGLDIAHPGMIFGMLDRKLTTKDNEVIIDGREDVKELLSMLERVARIPGNVLEEHEDFFMPWSYPFVNEQSVAMTVHARYIARMTDDAEQEANLNYDFVSWPVGDKGNLTQPFSAGNHFAISALSEHKEEAFKVIDFLSSSEWLDDYIDPLDYGREGLKNKNMEAFIRNPYKIHEDSGSAYESIAQGALADAVNEMVFGGIDVNSAMRLAQELAEIRIKERLAAE